MMYSVTEEVRKFAADVKALRHRLGCSQSIFAEAVGVNRRTLQGWEIGRFVPEYPSLILMALKQRVNALAARGRPVRKDRRRRRA